MDVVARASLPCPVERAFAELAELDDYPRWLTIVGTAEPVPADARDGGPAWMVELAARLGPVRRAKRLRMVRTMLEPPVHVRFERRERDSRMHSDWVLDIRLTDGAPVLADLGLHYGGARWLPLVDAVLASEIRRAGGRLAARVA